MLTVLKVFNGNGLNVLFFHIISFFFFAKLVNYEENRMSYKPLILSYMLLIDN